MLESIFNNVPGLKVYVIFDVYIKFNIVPEGLQVY